MEYCILINFIIYFYIVSTVYAEDTNFQACIDKYSRKGFQPWQEWSDHYTCHRYRCEIRDGKYFIAAVGCRKPKIPENALECNEYIEDENVEFPTCCARLRCVVEVNGERIVHTRGQPGELFLDKPWKEQQNDPSLALMGMNGHQQNTAEGSAQMAASSSLVSNKVDAGDNGRRYVDHMSTQFQDTPRKRRSASNAHRRRPRRMADPLPPPRPGHGSDGIPYRAATKVYIFG